jgi:chromosomal replication initiation ATPase DnaA
MSRETFISPYLMPGLKIKYQPPEKIIEEVCKYFPHSDIYHHDRLQINLIPRMIAVKLMRDLSGMKNSEIIRYFASKGLIKDHTTFTHYYKAITNWIATDKEMRNRFEDILKVFTEKEH